MNSGKLTEKFKQEIGKYSGIVNNANQADEKVKSKIRLCERDVTLMSGPRESLVERIPPITASATHQTQAVNKLRELWGVMSQEMQKVEPLEKRLNEIKYDPTTEYLQMLKTDGNLDDAKAASFASTKIDSLLGSIAKEVSDNKNLRINVLEEMRVWHQQVHSGSAADEGRTKALQQLAAAYDAYLECTSNLNEGTKFYNDLKTLLTRLQQQVDDFVFARQTEKEDIINVLEPGKHAADLIKSLVDKTPQPSVAATAPQSSVPPPRPPPPSNTANASGFAAGLIKSIHGVVNRSLEMGMGQNAPSVPPRTDASAPAPSVPQHQQYQPNTAPNYNWQQHGQPGQQPPQGYYQQPYPQQQGYFQQMPNLPYYGAAFQQPAPGTQQPYMMPYPTQPYGYPQPQYGNQQPPASQQPPTSNNPFAQ